MTPAARADPVGHGRASLTARGDVVHGSAVGVEDRIQAVSGEGVKVALVIEVLGPGIETSAGVISRLRPSSCPISAAFGPRSVMTVSPAVASIDRPTIRGPRRRNQPGFAGWPAVPTRRSKITQGQTPEN